jgi:hypothetical protein
MVGSLVIVGGTKVAEAHAGIDYVAGKERPRRISAPTLAAAGHRQTCAVTAHRPGCHTSFIQNEK